MIPPPAIPFHALGLACPVPPRPARARPDETSRAMPATPWPAVTIHAKPCHVEPCLAIAFGRRTAEDAIPYCPAHRAAARQTARAASRRQASDFFAFSIPFVFHSRSVRVWSATTQLPCVDRGEMSYGGSGHDQAPGRDQSDAGRVLPGQTTAIRGGFEQGFEAARVFESLNAAASSMLAAPC
jgi:hypothetical protein